MSESQIVFEKKKISFSGTFEFKELLKTIDHFMDERDYSKKEKEITEKVTEEGSDVKEGLEYSKGLNEYATSILNVDIEISKAIDTIVELDNIKHPMTTGEITINVTGLLKTELGDKYEDKPTYFFLKSVFDKVLFKNEIEKYTKVVTKDAEDLIEEIKSFLNLYNFN